MLREYGKIVWLLLFVGVAAAGALWYAKYRRHVPALLVETTGLARHRRARTAAWTERRGAFSISEKDHIQVRTETSARIGSERISPGTYEVARIEGGGLGLVSSTAEAFEWEPQPLGAVEIRAMETELSRLRQDLARHQQMPNLWPAREWLAMKGLDLDFNDYLVRLVEPPSGRRLSPGAEIRLHWTPIPYDDVNYAIEIASSMDFRGFTPRSSRANRLSVQLSQPGLYFWRVRAKRRGRSILSNASSFEVR